MPDEPAVSTTPEPASVEPVAETTSVPVVGQGAEMPAEASPPLPETAQNSSPEVPVEPAVPNSGTPQMGGNEAFNEKNESFPAAAEPPPATSVFPSPSVNFMHELAQKARVLIQNRKQKKLDKILVLFAIKEAITNQDVQKLIHVSRQTATRYLDLLQKEGKITQVGKTGHMVKYRKII